MVRGPGNSTSPNKMKELEKTFQTEQTPMGKNLNNAINQFAETTRRRVEKQRSNNDATGFGQTQTFNAPKPKMSQRGRKLVEKMNSNTTDEGKLPAIHSSPAARAEAEIKERSNFKQPKPKKKVKKATSGRPDDEFQLDRPDPDRCILLEFFDPAELKLQI